MTRCPKGSDSNFPYPFERSDVGATCVRKDRTRQKHLASCSHITHGKGPVKLGSLGGCYLQCDEGDKDILGTCWPKSTIKVSIGKIGALFEDLTAALFDFIKDKLKDLYKLGTWLIALPLVASETCIVHTC